MGVFLCPQCSKVVSEGMTRCPECGFELHAAHDNVANSSAENDKAAEPQTVAVNKPGKAKRVVVRLISTIFAVTLIAAGALIILFGPKSDKGNEHAYAPWADLDAHFDLGAVTEVEGVSHFNSYELSSNRLPMTREHVADGHYPAVVLGKGVWVRSYPQLKSRTKRCQVQTGDQLMVTRSAGYSTNGYWSYVSILSGYCAGKEGYIPNDYIIEQDKFNMLQRYVFTGNTHMDIDTPSKYLNAIATVLLKLEADKRLHNLSVSLVDAAVFSQQSVVTYVIHDRNVAKNSTLLAFVLFFNNNNDYVVLGIVPGVTLNHVKQNANGSYDIYYVREHLE